MGQFFSYWTEENNESRDRLLKIIGLVLAVTTIFALISSVSYMFSWKADQSLLSDTFTEMSQGGSAHNIGGGLGNKFGYLLVGRWFGFGSFALIVAFVVTAIKLLFPRRPMPVVKAVLLSIAAAIILSFFFAFFSIILGLDNVFGGGLGGECGSNMVRWSINLVGPVVTLFFIIALSVSWLFFASKKFSVWFASLGAGSDDETTSESKRSSVKRKSVRKEDDILEEKIDDREEEKPEKKTFTWWPAKKNSPEEEKRAPLKEEETIAQAHADEVAKEIIDEPVVPEVTVEPVPEVEKPVESKVESAPMRQASSVRYVSSAESTVPAAKAEPASADQAGIEIIEGEELSTDVVKELPRINVRDELKDYRFPPLSILEDYENSRQEVSQEELKRNNFKIRATLKTYKIDIDNVKAIVGPTVTLYKVYPAPGVRIASIKRLQEDIAMSLNAKGVRVVTLADSVGIEVANDRPSIVPLKALLNDTSFRESKAELPIAIGYTITQKVKVFDLADAPHLLVAGATKQGKSVGLNVLITSLLYSKHPSELKFVFIDPKKVEFSAYSRLLKHYLAVLPNAASEADERNNAIAKDSKPAEQVLRSLCIEMDDRYELLSKALVNNVKSYNEKYKDRHLLPTEGHRYLPYIVVVIDEYADLTMSTGATGDAKTLARNISQAIIRLAQKGRAAGIHIVLATQRPSVDVVTGLIKANFPTRVAFRVLSMTDSKTILDSTGAEKLIGRGDMLYYAGVEMERVQCALISSEEISEVTKFIGDQTGYAKSYNTPYYLPAPEPDQVEDGVSGGLIDMKNLDERFVEAAKLVVSSQRGSTSDLQRRLGMGYAKAGRVMDQLEAAGIVGPQEGSKPRMVLVNDLAELDTILQAYVK